MKTMNTKRSSLAAAMSTLALAFVTVPMLPAQTSSNSSNNNADRSMSEQRADSSWSADKKMKHNKKMAQHGTRAENVIGMQILAANDQDIGEVQDLVIDSHSGKIVYAIVQTGGVLGIGARERAVPFSALKLKQGDATAGMDNMNDNASRVGVGNYFTMDLSRDQWEKAPIIEDRSFFNDDSAQRDRLFEYYGASADYLKSSNRRDSRSMTTAQNNSSGNRANQQQPRNLVRATEIMDIELVNRALNDDVGEIEDVIVNVERRAASLLVEPEGGDDRTAGDVLISFSKVNFARNDDNEPATTELTNRDFAEARVFESDRWNWDENDASPYVWTEMTAGGAIATPGAYGYAQNMTDAANGAKRINVGDLRDRLENEPLLENALGDVNIEQSGEQLVLTGKVDTKKQKDRITELARRFAAGWKIDNRIQVRSVTE